MQIILDAKWKFLAKDKDHSICVYSGRPKSGYVAWGEGGDYVCKTSLFSIPELENIPWDESLREIMPDGTLRKPYPDLAVDTPVWVYDVYEWIPRHFKEWSSNGDMITFDGGKTSHSADCRRHSGWACYSLTDPNHR